MAEETGIRRLILLAEDNDDLRKLLKTWLITRGYEVAEATNGGEAVELCQQRPPDLILTDLQMPVIDGITAIKYIRRDERLRHIPVVAISAFGDWGMDLFLSIESFGDAPVEYLAKPSSFEDFETLDRLFKELLPAEPGA